MEIVSKNTHADVVKAAHALIEGRLVAFPTETVYGLAADATQGKAVARIFEAKGRPSFNPLIVHVGERAWVSDYAQTDERFLRLAEAFWPGPLTCECVGTEAKTAQRDGAGQAA